MAYEKPKQTANEFPREVLNLFDKYVHGAIDRRGFLDGAAKFAVGGVTAAGLLEALSPRFAQAQQVQGNDPRIRTETVEFVSPQGYGKGRGYLVRPAATSGPLPVVLVVHENRGLNPHIEDIARRVALEGYIAFAPDALFPLGGYPANDANPEDKAREAFGKLEQPKTQQDFLAASVFAKALQGSNGKLGVVGFCWGGQMSNYLATQVPDLSVAVPFYGPAPAIDQVPNIKATMMIVFAENDTRVNDTWPAYEAALKAGGKSYQAFKYPGTEHGFNNDTTPRYNEAAAKQAWQRTIEIFNRTLKG